MKSALLLLCCLLSLSTMAQRRHPIDAAHKRCLAKDGATGDGTPGGYRTCDIQALRQWNAEIARLLTKLPNQKVAQSSWLRHLNNRVLEIKNGMKADADIKADADLTMSDLDQIRWYKMDSTRKRVLQLTKLAGEKGFDLPPNSSDYADKIRTLLE
jgi:hypothetical protein